MADLTYATRRSALALAQCRAFVARVRAAHAGVRLTELQVVTTGDTVQDRPLAEIGGKGLFVKEIEEALLEHRADLAVHSMKDVPAALPPGLALVCVPLREDPRDALVSPVFGTLSALPRGARVGTSSLRRKLALLTARPDLDVVPLRGNVDTRLRKLDAGDVAAIVLAYAGLLRLGLGERATEVLPTEVSLPAIGQGALGIEAREDDRVVRELVSPLHDAESAVAVAAERGVLVALGADCKTPVAAHAHRLGGELVLRAVLADATGARARSAERRAPWPGTEVTAAELGASLAAELG